MTASWKMVLAKGEFTEAVMIVWYDLVVWWNTFVASCIPLRTNGWSNSCKVSYTKGMVENHYSYAYGTFICFEAFEFSGTCNRVNRFQIRRRLIWQTTFSVNNVNRYTRIYRPLSTHLQKHSELPVRSLPFVFQNLLTLPKKLLLFKYIQL